MSVQLVKGYGAVENLGTARAFCYDVHMHLIQEKLLEQIEENRNLGNLTLRDIGKRIGESSPQRVKHHLMQLEKNGFINLDRKLGIIKQIKKGAVKDSSSLVAIPVLGYASCGPASMVAEQRPEGFLKVSSRLLPKAKKIFALQAVGNSLNKAEIGKEKRTLDDGDFAIIDYENVSPKDGDYILSVIDGMANLKRFKSDKENEQIVLYSESTQNYRPIFIHPNDDYTVGGKLVAVLKNPT
jgi:SOS-response transcriptional repressor LexA